MDSEDPQPVGARLAEARRACGISQRQLAAHLGVTVRTIQNYESGSSSPERHLHEIAALTRVRATWILYGDETNTPLSGRVATLQKTVHEQLEVLAHHLEVMQTVTKSLEDQTLKRRAARPGGPSTVGF